jgi:hypothetical protein
LVEELFNRGKLYTGGGLKSKGLIGGKEEEAGRNGKV